MGRAPEAEILSRVSIKPSSPTPPHLKYYKLSLLDQISPVEYAPILFFYAASGENEKDRRAKAAHISQRLKKSLSETLTKFYPFAGIIKGNSSIECNDNGAEYVEARANCCLSDILQNPDQKLLREFLPIEVESTKAAAGPLLLVQATFFKCGGMVLGNCFSHMVADGSTISTFILSWTGTATQSKEAAAVQPKYVTSSVFPADESLIPNIEQPSSDNVTKRFVFDAAKIAKLRTKVASESVPKPTCVEAVSAMIWKCSTNASRSIRGFPRPSLLWQTMNMRRVIKPPLPDNCVGNIVGYFPAQTTEKDIVLQDLVRELREGKEDFRKNGLKTIIESKSLDTIPGVGNKLEERDDIDVYFYSSVSRFPIYHVDFGWGKPVWVTMPNYMFKNVVMLLGTRDGAGIEALVTLSVEDMELFERDKDLLEFAALNPSIYIS